MMTDRLTHTSHPLLLHHRQLKLKTNQKLWAMSAGFKQKKVMVKFRMCSTSNMPLGAFL